MERRESKQQTNTEKAHQTNNNQPEIWRGPQRDFNFLLVHLIFAEDALEAIESRLESILADVDWRGYQESENACRESAELAEQALMHVRQSMRCYKRVSRYVSTILFPNQQCNEQQGRHQHDKPH